MNPAYLKGLDTAKSEMEAEDYQYLNPSLPAWLMPLIWI